MLRNSTECISNDGNQQHIVHIINPMPTIECGQSRSLQVKSLSISSALFAPFTACLSRKNRLTDKSTHTCASSQSSDEEYYLLEDDGCVVEEELKNQKDVCIDGIEGSCDRSSSECVEDRVLNCPAHSDGGIDEQYRVKEYSEHRLNDDIDDLTQNVDLSINSTDNCPFADIHTGDVAGIVNKQNSEENSTYYPSKPTTSMNLPTLPINPRSKTCAPNTDLSGSWALVITDEFKSEYDNYLTVLGINYFVRKVALQVIYQTTEVIEQSSGCGTELSIIGSNPKGVWDRTLIASNGVKVGNNDENTFEHERFHTTTADGEDIMSEAWWEEGGTVHRSYLFDAASKYGGGDFESKRYLNAEDNYNCVSTFHPRTKGLAPVSITWKYSRVVE